MGMNCLQLYRVAAAAAAGTTARDRPNERQNQHTHKKAREKSDGTKANVWDYLHEHAET